VTSGSLGGFALVFVLIAWMLSGLGGLALLGGRAWLRRCGPAVERRAAGAVAVLPVLLALAVAIALIVRSVVGSDHCAVHHHHAHLCVVHGAVWLERGWVVAALAAVGALVAMRIVLLFATLLRGYRSIAEIASASATHGRIRIVESHRAFSFVAGLVHPAIYVSSRAWAALTEPEREAVVAHEHAHIARGDLRARLILEAMLALAAPLIGEIVRASWRSACERLCDVDAVDVVQDPAAVASAMVALCRLNASCPRALGFTPTAHELAERVHALLDGQPSGVRAAAVLGRVIAAGALAIIAITAVAAEPLHHALETLLG
jgi:beta-lactamase regulating signal transducer with metallopeptidase domain